MRAAFQIAAAALALASIDAAAQTAETAPPAEGESPEVAESRRHYAQGVVFFRANRFEQAIAEFTEAYRIWANPTILYSLGQAHERVMRIPKAIEHYQRYLDEAPADAPNRAAAETSIRSLSDLLAFVRIESNVPARVFANGEEVGEAPGTIQLATGRYDLELRAEGHEPARETVTVAARSERTLTITLRPIPTGGGERIIVRERAHGGIAPTWFWTGAVITGVAAATGVVLGVVTLGKASSIDEDPLPSTDDRDSGERLALLTDVALGTAIIFSTASLLLYLNTDWGSSESEEQVRPEVSLSGDGAVLSLRGAL